MRTDRDGREAATSQGRPEPPGARRGRRDPPPEPPERGGLECQTLAFRNGTEQIVSSQAPPPTRPPSVPGRPHCPHLAESPSGRDGSGLILSKSSGAGACSFGESFVERATHQGWELGLSTEDSGAGSQAHRCWAQKPRGRTAVLPPAPRGRRDATLRVPLLLEAPRQQLWLQEV